MAPSSPNSPIDFVRDEKKRALRVLEEDQDFPRECLDLVQFLADATIRNPNFQTTRAGICQHVLGLVDEDELPRKSHLREAHRIIDLTRRELCVAAKRPEARISAFYIKMGYGTKKTGIRLNFLRYKKRTANPSKKETVAPGGSADRLWLAMLNAINARTAILVFDTPEVGLPNRSLDRNGWWAGSGEVAAAFLLGQCFSRLNRNIRVRRWRDMDQEDLTLPDECLVILGSSLTNPWLKRLRERERWIDQQAFHFEGPEKANSRGRVCKRSLAAGKKDTKQEDCLAFDHQEATSGNPETDFALVSCFHDARYRQTLIALQGITTGGTHAATAYMCGSNYVDDLHRFIDERHGCDLSAAGCSFEVLLKVQINDMLPVNIKAIDSVIY